MSHDLLALLGEPHTPAILQRLTGINPKTYYDLLHTSVLSPDMTYLAALQTLFKHYQKAEGVARERLAWQREEAEVRKRKSDDPDAGMPAVIRAEKLQKIKLDQAREQEIWLRNAQTRKTLCDVEELYKLLEPFILSQKMMLVQAGLTTPALQPVVAKCLNELYGLGERITELAHKDTSSYVSDMCNKEVDLEGINASLTSEGLTHDF